MKTHIVIALIAACTALPASVPAKEKRPAGPIAPIGWLEIHTGSRKLSVAKEDLQRASRNLAQGLVIPVYKTKEKHGQTLARVGALNLETGSAELGWMGIDRSELKPAESYPSDNDLLRQLGGPYLDDFTADHTDISRYLVRQGDGPPALLCYVLTPALSMAKLVIFSPQQGTYAPTTTLNITIGELDGGITSIEVRDLIGDGSDCVITKEHFREQAQTFGKMLRIRQIAEGKFLDLWKAPIEYQNLSQYNSQMQMLRPAEQNIGAPGTKTTGDVTFRPTGRAQEPVWKGKIEFYVAGREKALDSVSLEKACPWDGHAFAPLR